MPRRPARSTQVAEGKEVGAAGVPKVAAAHGAVREAAAVRLARLLLLSRPEHRRVRRVSDGRKKLGVYRFDLQGKNWELVSSQDAFADVYVRDDKVLFALVRRAVALTPRSPSS